MPRITPIAAGLTSAELMMEKPHVSFLSGVRLFLAGKAHLVREKLQSRAGNDQLVAVVILICVVIGLCTVFRNQIYTLFTGTIFPGLQDAATGFLNFNGTP